MKRIFAVTLMLWLLFHAGNPADAQSSWQWAKRGGGIEQSDWMTGMATDKHGNIYVLASNSAQDTVDVDGHPGISAQDRVTLASWDCNGNFRWMKSLGGAGAVSVWALAADTSEGVYVGFELSALSQSVYFDTDTTLSGKKGFGIIKYNTTGALEWLKMLYVTTAAPGPNIPVLFAVDAAPDGDIFCYAYLYPGSYDNSAFTVSAGGYYVIRYSASGAYQALIPLAMQSSIPGGSDFFKRDHRSGRFYIGGSYIQSAFGTLTIGNTTINAANSTYPMYAAAFAPGGSNIWVKQGSQNKTAGARLSISEDGHLYIGGVSETDNIFNGDTLIKPPVPAIYAPYVLALDSNGVTLWTTNGIFDYGNPPYSAIHNIAYINNTIALSGICNGQLQWDSFQMTLTKDILLVRLNAATGTVTGVDSIRFQYDGVGNYVVADKNSNFYLGGYFSPTLFFPNNTLATLTNDTLVGDWFVAKYGSNTCNCDLPLPEFTYTGSAAAGYSFTYTGTAPYTSITWDFGDGTALAGTPNPSHTYTGPGNYAVCVTVATGCGSNTRCHYVNMDPTGVHGLQGLAGIRYYPNPATQNLMIEDASPGTVLELYNMQGVLVLRTTLRQETETIPVDNLAAGVYVMRLTDRNGNQGYGRMVKE